MAVIEVLQNISKVMDKLYDFAVSDEFLSLDFEEYIKENEINIETQSELNNVLTEYLLDKKTQMGQRVLDYYLDKNKDDEKIINSFKNNYEGIFKIKKISKNMFETYSILNEKDMTLLSLIKASSLKGIGRFDFLHARLIEFENVFYILEIFDIIGSNYEKNANEKGLKMLIERPERLVWKNEEKLEKVKKENKKIYEKFIKAFGKDTIITTNKSADKLIADFNLYVEDKIQDFDKNFEKSVNFSYFKIKEFEGDDFLQNASKGFSNHEECYDIGLFCDIDYGFFAIPFLGTFEQVMLGKNIENSNKLVLDFLFDDKIPPSIFKNCENFVQIVNSLFQDEKFNSVDEIINKFKENWGLGFNFSSTTALYNSELFANYMGFKN